MGLKTVQNPRCYSGRTVIECQCNHRFGRIYIPHGHHSSRSFRCRSTLLHHSHAESIDTKSLCLYTGCFSIHHLVCPTAALINRIIQIILLRQLACQFHPDSFQWLRSCRITGFHKVLFPFLPSKAAEVYLVSNRAGHACRLIFQRCLNCSHIGTAGHQTICIVLMISGPAGTIGVHPEHGPYFRNICGFRICFTAFNRCPRSIWRARSAGHVRFCKCRKCTTKNAK